MLRYLLNAMLESKSRSDKRKERNADPARKKSIGEKVANVLFNGGRSAKAQHWGEERVGTESGKTVKVDRNKEGEQEGAILHKTGSGGIVGHDGSVVHGEAREVGS
jgi:hypothetical protein